MWSARFKPRLQHIQASHISVILLPNVMITAMFCFPARTSMWLCVGVSVCVCVQWVEEGVLVTCTLIGPPALQGFKSSTWLLRWPLHFSSMQQFYIVPFYHYGTKPFMFVSSSLGWEAPFFGNWKITICMLFICLQGLVREISFFCLLCRDMLTPEANKGCFYLQDAVWSVSV